MGRLNIHFVLTSNMRLSVVFICASILVLSEARGSGKRGNKGGNRGKWSKKRDESKKSDKKGGKKEVAEESSSDPPAWTKFCETLDKWSEKPGKQGMVKRCKCYLAKAAGEEVSEECQKVMKSPSKFSEKPQSIFEKLCSKAK